MLVGVWVAVLAISAGAGEARSQWEDVPAPATRATATSTPTATASATPSANSTPSPAEPSEEADPDGDAPAEVAPARTAASDAGLPAAPPGPALADAGPLLLSRVERARGHAIERVVEPSGDIVEHEVNAAGTVQSCRKVGSLLTLRIVSQQPTAGGESLQVARDLSGALVQYVVSSDGEPRAVALLAPAP